MANLGLNSVILPPYVSLNKKNFQNQVTLSVNVNNQIWAATRLVSKRPAMNEETKKRRNVPFLCYPLAGGGFPNPSQPPLRFIYRYITLALAAKYKECLQV